MSRSAVLLVGLGRWGEKHLRVLRDLGLEVWTADVAEERRAWAIRQGVVATHVVADYRAALAHVDAVDVVTPAGTHRAVAETALAAGRHCFVEKPLAGTLADARDLCDRARAGGLVLQVGHVFRFHPVTATLRRALADGRIGAVRFATARFAGFKRPRTDVGVTLTDGIHYFDLFAHLFARPASSVAAVQRDYLGRGLDDLSITVVHYGHVVAIVEADYFVPGTHRECVIVGETGSLVADFGTGAVTLHGGRHQRRGDAWEVADTGKEQLPTAGDEPLRVELQAFVDACAGRAPNPVPADDALHAMEVVEAAARSATLSRTVALTELG